MAAGLIALLALLLVVLSVGGYRALSKFGLHFLTGRAEERDQAVGAQ